MLHVFIHLFFFITTLFSSLISVHINYSYGIIPSFQHLGSKSLVLCLSYNASRSGDSKILRCGLFTQYANRLQKKEPALRSFAWEAFEKTAGSVLLTPAYFRDCQAREAFLEGAVIGPKGFETCHKYYLLHVNIDKPNHEIYFDPDRFEQLKYSISSTLSFWGISDKLRKDLTSMTSSQRHVFVPFEVVGKWHDMWKKQCAPLLIGNLNISNLSVKDIIRRYFPSLDNEVVMHIVHKFNNIKPSKLQNLDYLVSVVENSFVQHKVVMELRSQFGNKLDDFIIDAQSNALLCLVKSWPTYQQKLTTELGFYCYKPDYPNDFSNRNVRHSNKLIYDNFDQEAVARLHKFDQVWDQYEQSLQK